MVIAGTLYKKLEYKSYEKFNKQTFIVQSEKNYFKIEALGFQCEEVVKIEIGTNITVHCSVTGRLWKNKEGEEIFFNSIKAEQINIPQTTNQLTTDDGPEEEEYDLPF